MSTLSLHQGQVPLTSKLQAHKASALRVKSPQMAPTRPLGIRLGSGGHGTRLRGVRVVMSPKLKHQSGKQHPSSESRLHTAWSSTLDHSLSTRQSRPVQDQLPRSMSSRITRTASSTSLRRLLSSKSRGRATLVSPRSADSVRSALVRRKDRSLASCTEDTQQAGNLTPPAAAHSRMASEKLDLEAYLEMADQVKAAASCLAVSASAAALLFLLSPVMPYSGEAHAAVQSTGPAALLEQLVPGNDAVVADSDGAVELHAVDQQEVDNLGFLSVDEQPLSQIAAESLDARSPDAEVATNQPLNQETPSDALTGFTGASGSSADGASTSTSTRWDSVVADDSVPLTRKASAGLASAPSSPSPGPIPAFPAFYTPNAASVGPSSPVAAVQGGQSATLVPVAASAAAAATLSSTVPSALAEAVASAPSLISSAASEAMAVAAEPLVAGAAAATEAVAAGAAAATEAVAVTAASASSGLTTKLSLILAQSLQHLGVGGVAGAVGATVVYPLDTVKTRMQAQVGTKRQEGDAGEGESETPVETGAPVNKASEPYKNEIDCMVRMVKEEGVASLYSGIGPQLVGIAPEKAVKLAANEMLLAILESLLPGTRVWVLEFLAGGGGGACQVVFSNPVEAVKVRMQASPDQMEGTPKLKCQTVCSVESGAKSEGSDAATCVEECVVVYEHQQRGTIEVIKELGLKGLYTGSALTLARDVPSTALFFACYAFLMQPDTQERFMEAAAGLSPSAYIFLAACASSIPAAVLVTPFDVIKTRIQIRPTSEGRHPSGMEMAKEIVAQEGPSALFKGAIARAVRVGPQFGITLMIYDWLCKHW